MKRILVSCFLVIGLAAIGCSQTTDAASGQQGTCPSSGASCAKSCSACPQAAGSNCPCGCPAGCTALFNGKDLTGWVELGSEGSWSVADGVLKCNGKKTGYAWLCTEKKYGNFTLCLEYRIFEDGNSGVFCLVPKREGRASMEGFESQITAQMEGELNEHTPGSVFQRAVAKSRPSKPAGQWNRMSIACKGKDITIAINGTVIIEMDKTKIENMAKVPDEGYIGLQNHGSPVEFRNICIHKL